MDKKHCPNCGTSNPVVYGNVASDPSVGLFDEVILYSCTRCGHEFSTISDNLPRIQAAYKKPKADPEIARNAKEFLISKILEVVGSDIPNLRWTLRVLAHPEVITYTKQYFNAVDEASMCTQYEAPWSCAREAEARFENIQYGWLAGGNGVGLAEWWCENCRRKVLE